MNCRKVSHFLSAYMDGELPGVEHRQIHAHLGACADCAQEYRSLLQTKRLLAGMRVREAQGDLPARLLEKVHAHNAAAQTARPSLPGRWRGDILRKLTAPQPRFQYFALAATLSTVGIVYASYAIDQSEKIVFHQATPTEIASLPPAMIETPAPEPSVLPSVSPWQPVGNTYYTPYSDPLLPNDSASRPFKPSARRSGSVFPPYYQP